MQDKYLSELQQVEASLGEVIEKGKLMHNRRQTERATFHGEIQSIRQRSSTQDKDIKRLKVLIEEERNDEFVELLEAQAEDRANEYSMLIEDIQRLAAEVKDAKRFNVYKQVQAAYQ